MESVKFPTANTVFKAPRGWDHKKLGECGDLHVQIDDGVFTSVWKPSPAELYMLSLGARIVLHVWGGQPPVAVVTQFIEE